ncbi:MAG TPA: hotdog fold thioesterase [Actinobacteria bacterium]|nr:acyl-coenzyme A thioesterase PaaI [bacterium BMS3Bbin02]HDL41998.1 hotdog fold thioesterase [Actinomycetota bacterium]
MNTPSRARALFDGDTYAQHLGARFVSDTEDSIIIELTVTHDHCNVHGTLHGAVSYALADIAFAIASNVAGPPAVAIDVHMVYSGAAGPGDTITARCTELRRGRSLATYRSDVTAGDKLIGAFTGTVLIKQEP